MKISSSSKRWINFVDTTTVTWLGLFIIGFIALDTNLLCLKEQGIWGKYLEELTDPFCINTYLFLLPQGLEKPIYIINWIIWIIFVMDLILKYIEIRNYKVFLVKHWFDIILLIPFFRILSLLRFLRLCIRIYEESRKLKK
ncbi:MAG: hypothetical protein ACPKPY_00125 [Nitrososphaeraceae archaeon]